MVLDFSYLLGNGHHLFRGNLPYYFACSTVYDGNHKFFRVLVDAKIKVPGQILHKTGNIFYSPIQLFLASSDFLSLARGRLCRRQIVSAGGNSLPLR